MDPQTGNGYDHALLMATSARFRWPSPRRFVSAYAQNLMAADIGWHGTSRGIGESAGQRHNLAPVGRVEQTFDIFEGTEQIQQLVISRAISGLRVE